MRRDPVLLALLVFLLFAAPLVAQDQGQDKSRPVDPKGSVVGTQDTPSAATSSDELRKAIQNPVANLISFPLENNSNFGVGPYNRIQNVLDIQPVVPVHLSTSWILITRTIMPIIYQPTTIQPVNQGAHGLGDVNPTFFLSPAKPHKIIWGVGPDFVFPTATNPLIGQGKWSVGPSLVALAQPKHFTIGVLVNNVWSFAGQANRTDVNQMLLEPFINYNMKKGWFLVTAPFITANWKGSRGNVWTVPVGGGIGRVTKLGFQPVSLEAEFYGNATYPSGTSSWSMRLQISFLFPRLTKDEEKMLLEEKLKQLEQRLPPKKSS